MIKMSDTNDRRIKAALYTAVLNKLSGELSELEAKEVLLTNAPAYITSKDHDHADHIEELKNIILDKVHLKDAIKDIKSVYFAEQIAKANEKTTNS
jgi:hypothetical protein|tara:strand:- start:447 stop:734 length:288 start_codon:yes stop_codon:yes gene_type:complete